eukprot:TRINITY_DN6517_c1_g3_i1.p2 TRINITY_DN6517_c1_g3~~TRINITY_DN6517_c1_g3_i1.p2  ORF type:complete len:209 (+),score=56.62 TRINITY_DN6517_c1_g3_i1:61-627(+)
MLRIAGLMVTVCVVAILIGSTPVGMKLLLKYSDLDDGMAEECFVPDVNMTAWDVCKNEGEKQGLEFEGMSEFPTGGAQVMADGFDADAAILNNSTQLTNILNTATLCSGSTVLKHISHSFNPQGATLLGLLSTSHYAVHTWPERSAFTLDVYFCTPEAKEQVHRFAKIVCEAVKAKTCCMRTLRRPLL